jgi:TolA-binding protein
MFTLLAQVDLANHVSSTVSSGEIDINQLAHLSGGNPMMIVALGAIAVLGGKKVWDWLKQRQEQQHEQKMAEIEASKAPTGSGHEQCVAKQQELEGHVTSLKGKITDLEKKASDIEKKTEENAKLNVEALDEVENSIKKIKKKVKKLEEAAEETDRKKGK